MNSSFAPAVQPPGAFDPVDLRLLGLLQQDAAQSNLALAAAAGVSPATALRRVRRLVEAGVIERQVALLAPQAVGLPLAALEPWQVMVPGGRSRRLQLGEISVLDETYNASPEAVLAALALLDRQPGRHFAVLGTMLELGDQSVALHRSVAERAVQLGLDGLVLVAGGPEGEAMLAAAAALPRLQRVESPEAAAAVVAEWLRPGDQLLLKASRGVALERALPLLEQRFNPASASSP